VPAADDSFVSFAALLRVPPEPPAPAEAPPDDVVTAVAEPVEYADVLRDLRVFRARLADALEAACAALDPADAAEARLGVRLAAVLDALR
jgi:hypothetical protein